MRNLAILLVVMLVFAACNPKITQITINNTADYAVAEKPVLIQRADLEAQAGKIDGKKIPFLKDELGNLLPAQLDDMDGDGNWDELFALVDLNAGESKAFTLVLMDAAKAPEVKQRTNIRFADKENPENEFTEAERLKSTTTEVSQKYFQYEGPGWENDMVGFRNYFDARNGMDIWGKTTGAMVLDGVGLKDGPSYHEMQAWGMDILKVGTSLGAGAIALQIDSVLHRVGTSGYGTYKLVAEGPLRSTFDLHFKGIQIGEDAIDVNHRICIIAGKPWYKSVVAVTSPIETKLVTGIVNMQSEEYFTASADRYAYFYTHTNQGFENEVLGMAIIVPQNQIEVQTAPEEGEGIIQTFYTALETGEKPNVYFFMAGWERQDARWASKAEFEQGVIEQAQLITAKLDVVIQ